MFDLDWATDLLDVPTLRNSLTFFDRLNQVAGFKVPPSESPSHGLGLRSHLLYGHRETHVAHSVASFNRLVKVARLL